ncbi:MAG: CHAP domain-containing protein, partial [Eubacterium sp.]|nr:CHAP domain-containing protein [Eubacterium sp.]
MGIRKSKESSFHRVRSGFALSHHVVRKTSAQIDPLLTSEEDQRKQEGKVDPTRFMTRKQKKAWRRLSPAKRKQYIRRATLEAHHDHATKGVAVKDKVSTFSNRELTADPETAKRLAGWQLGRNGYGRGLPSLRRLRARKKKERSGSEQENIATESASDVNTGNLNRRLEDNSSPHPSTGSTYPSQAAITQGGTASKTFTVMEGTISSTGAGTAVTTSKKAADHFNRELKARTLAVQEQKKKEARGKPGDAYPVPLKAGAITLGAMLTAVIQAAVQLVSSILSILTMILVPLAIVAMIISFTVSLLTGIGGAVDEAGFWYMGGGMELVEVAIKEIGYKEGADGSTKYGTWAGIGNASWCHAFVSWCANECGFIEEGIIPRTASCEEGRQWFITRNEYQERGSYEPAPGDIVYFRHGDETVSHHVGIVEYAENGILHTIEGNSGGLVKRREYPLTADRIMGYGLPGYPDDGYGEFGSGQDFLKYVRTIGQTIVSDGDWIYSNADVKGNFTDARKAGRHATNCALAASWCMQEFGTLKKDQHIYADWDGNIHCSSATRKRIDKYYEVINIGGKRNANGVKLKPGDICIWNIHVNVYAGEEGGKKVWYDFSRNCISDKKPDSGTYVKFIRKGDIGQTLYKVLRLKDQDSYGSGKQYIVPKGMGTSYTYMGWAIIHDWPTRQNFLRKRSGEHYDSNGFAKVNGRYVIACTTTFGNVGDYIDFVLDNGKVIHAIMGDEKNQS